jgi:hypothetical protein
MNRSIRAGFGVPIRFLAAVLLVGLTAVAGEERERITTPNYQQASQYSTQYLRQFLYDTSVNPRWIGKTDVFWYSFRTSAGTNYYKVNPKAGTKEPLFDRVKLGGLLSEMVQKPLDPVQLSLQRGSVNDEGTKFKFVFDNFEYEYDLAAEKLAKLGRAPAQPDFPRGRGDFSREDYERFREEFQRRRDDEQRRDQQQEEQQQQQQQQDDQQRQQQDNQQQQDQQQQQREGQGRGQGQGFGGRTPDHRVWSPDRKAYVFAKGHNLYFVEVKPEDVKEEPKPAEAKPGETKPEGEKTGDGKTDETKKADDATKKDESKNADDKQDGAQKTEGQSTQTTQTQTTQTQSTQTQSGAQGATGAPGSQENELPIPRIDPKLDDTAIQLTTDGQEDYSFAGRVGGFGFGGRRGQQTTQQQGQQQQAANQITPDRKTRPNATWSKDSQSFYVGRTDSRGMQELWVINSLAQPRPTLEKYKYAMPGEENVRKQELFVYYRPASKFARLPAKWKDESFSSVHYGKAGDELRFVRRDRLLRNAEFCTLKIPAGETKCLIGEGFANAHLEMQSPRYIEETHELIWWSQRSGWGHFYLYDRNGALKNPITSGQFRASRIVDVDVAKRLLYFIGNGREPSENVYYEHLYCVHLDGTGLTLMDPGDASHRSVLSPTKQYLVDNCSRVDRAPVSVLRDASGKLIMELEKADLSRLEEIGWRLPETFIVKAGDGVTDLYGNMWKPFDFDPNKKYPIIAHVYPGPQTEGTTHTFSATAGEQQLAQLGFIVIQVGHRGGTPNRSKAYGSYGYFNLRDYGLADKKAAIEQLAARYPFIDIERVGLYGHSGGGFMTAAAMLQKPYNEFFKVGVATSGNHDNNVYNNSWSERYHGLVEVEVKEETQVTGTGGSGGAGGTGGAGFGRGGGFRGRFGTGQGTGRTGGTTQGTGRGTGQNTGERTGGSEEGGAFSVDESDYFFEHEMIDNEIDWLDGLGEIVEEEIPLADAQDERKEEEKKDGQKEQTKEGEKNDQTKKEETKKDEGAKSEQKTEEKTDDAKKEDVKKDQSKADDAKKEETKKEDAKSEGAKSDDAKKEETKKEETKKEETKKEDTKSSQSTTDAKKSETKTDDKNADEQKTEGQKSEAQKTEEKKTDDKKTEEKKVEEKKTRFEIKVPTNAELAANLKGRLFLIHGEADNNVHPANTLRLVDALIRANKRFDMLYLPNTRHSFGEYQPYVTQRMYEYFAEHLMGDYQRGADIMEKVRRAPGEK